MMESGLFLLKSLEGLLRKQRLREPRPCQHGSKAFVSPPHKGKQKKTGQKVMNDLLKQVQPLPISYMLKKLISHKDDNEREEEIQPGICALIRVTKINHICV